MSRSRAIKLSIIDTDIIIKGTISGKGRLIIKGTVDGRIEGETVMIAQEGCVKSNAKVISMTISGIFDGDLEAEGQVVITASGKCSGKIFCKDIVVENGGTLDAEVHSTGRQGEKSIINCQKQDTASLSQAHKALPEDIPA
jgi:cytoskeletal protein CcmA (bactofilin family)